MQNRVYETREEIQGAAITAWRPSKKGTIVAGTGTGKTFIGITIGAGQIRLGKIKSVLISVPTTNLIDQWKEEILHWGYPLDGIEIKCIQTIYKNEYEVDLLIVDEVHTATSNEYSKIFENVKSSQVLGLTATVDEDDPVIQKYCPVVFKAGIKESLAAGAFNDYIVYNVAVPFSKKEAAMYRKFDSLFKEAQIELLNIKREFIKKHQEQLAKGEEIENDLSSLSVFDIAQKYSGVKKKDITEENKNVVGWSKNFWSAMSMRKMLCYVAPSKITKALELYQTAPDKKWIIFCMNLKVAEALKEHIPKARVYHYKLKPNEKKKMLGDFSHDKFNCLISIRALDAGLNIPSINFGLSISGDSSQLTAIQRLGRIARVKKTKSVFINLVSKDSVDIKWVESRNKEIDNVVWADLSTVKKELNGIT